jgi:hypothetical protein
MADLPHAKSPTISDVRGSVGRTDICFELFSPCHFGGKG